MLSIFVGADVVKAKAEARKRARGAEVVLFGEGGELFEHALHYSAVRGLFAPKVVLLIDRPFETAEGRTFIAEHAAALHKADADVFVIAPALSAADKKLFPTGGVEFKEFDVAKAAAPPRPNVFGFTDAFLSGDRKKAWTLSRRLIAEGVAPEEIHGALSWAVRSALIAVKTKSATEAGLKPFVFTKSKRAAEKLGIERTEALSRAIVAAYHNARSGRGTLELNTEALILER